MGDEREGRPSLAGRDIRQAEWGRLRSMILLEGRAMTLTRYEAEVLWLLDARLSNAEIAAVLHISPETVKRHTRSIYRKLTVHARHETIDGPMGATHVACVSVEHPLQAGDVAAVDHRPARAADAVGGWQPGGGWLGEGRACTWGPLRLPHAATSRPVPRRLAVTPCWECGPGPTGRCLEAAPVPAWRGLQTEWVLARSRVLSLGDVAILPPGASPQVSSLEEVVGRPAPVGHSVGGGCFQDWAAHQARPWPRLLPTGPGGRAGACRSGAPPAGGGGRGSSGARASPPPICPLVACVQAAPACLLGAS